MRAIDYFDRGADAVPDRIAIVDVGSQYSYRQTRILTQKIARAMAATGLGHECAGIYSHNHAGVLLCMLGIMRAGAVWVPINHRNGHDANASYMKYVGMNLVFYHSHFSERVGQLKSKVPSLRHLICLDRRDGDNPSLESFMAGGSDQELEDWADPSENPERLMGIVPTGGTTGPAKGVMVTDLAWGTMTELAVQCWGGSNAESVCLSAAPLSHAAGVVAFTMFAVGATNVIMPKFDALEVLRNIQRYRVSHVFLPPTAFYSLLAHPDVKKFDYSSLRVFLLAGGPVSPDKLKKGVETFGPCMCQCYGQTEAPMLLTWLDPETIAAAARGDHPERLSSCGRPTAGVRLAILNDQGTVLPPRQTGEIVARGTLVTPGYYDMPEATAEIRTYGWHHTGDIGYLDEDGYCYIVDRKKDLVITGGFNVYCAEVEDSIMALSEVYECAVIGIPDEKWGEAVKAIIVLREGAQLTEETVIARCKTNLGSVKSPKSVEFRNSIPKTPAGKVDRKQLREAYWANTRRAVH
ncbi:MAG: class I adenylate-forming enzyme family protein [Terriglobales bacterium]